MKRIVSQVLSESNYNLFEFDPANRATKQNKALLESMRKYGWLDAFPAMARRLKNGHLLILDGQNRCMCAKALGIPIKYVICSDDVDISIPEINQPQRPWNPTDYVTSFSKQGNKDYGILLGFAKQHKMSIGVAATILQNRGSISTHEVKDGTFKVRDMGKADAVIQTMNSAHKSGLNFWNHSRFISALCQIYRWTRANPDTMCGRIESNAGKMKPQANTDAYVLMLEDVYNYRARTVVGFRTEIKQGMLNGKSKNGKA